MQHAFVDLARFSAQSLQRAPATGNMRFIEAAAAELGATGISARYGRRLDVASPHPGMDDACNPDASGNVQNWVVRPGRPLVVSPPGIR
jgi:hypothetical protein